MIILRGLFVIIGSGAIAAVTHGTVLANGGFGSDIAPLYVALGCIQAGLALALGARLVRGWLIVASIVLLVLCEAANFLAPVDLQLTASENAAAPTHELAAKRKAAEAWIARLETDTRVERAERAAAKVQSDAMAKSAEKGCATNCRTVLEAQVREANAAVEAARADLQLETRQARAALDKAPLPPSATPLADKTGWQAWELDLARVGFRGFVVALGGAILLAAGAHRSRQEPVQPKPLPLELTGNVVAIAPKRTELNSPKAKGVTLPVTIGDVDAFMLDCVRKDASSRLSWVEAFVRYRGWCEEHKATPVDVSAFGARLDLLRAELGLETRTKGKEVFFVGLKLAS